MKGKVTVKGKVHLKYDQAYPDVRMFPPSLVKTLDHNKGKNRAIIPELHMQSNMDNGLDRMSNHIHKATNAYSPPHHRNIGKNEGFKICPKNCKSDSDSILYMKGQVKEVYLPPHRCRGNINNVYSMEKGNLRQNCNAITLNDKCIVQK